jgi:hypothetical protein
LTALEWGRGWEDCARGGGGASKSGRGRWRDALPVQRLFSLPAAAVAARKAREGVEHLGGRQGAGPEPFREHFDARAVEQTEGLGVARS